MQKKKDRGDLYKNVIFLSGDEIVNDFYFLFLYQYFLFFCSMIYLLAMKLLCLCFFRGSVWVIHPATWLRVSSVLPSIIKVIVCYHLPFWFHRAWNKVWWQSWFQSISIGNRVGMKGRGKEKGNHPTEICIWGYFFSLIPQDPKVGGGWDITRIILYTNPENELNHLSLNSDCGTPNIYVKEFTC